VTPDPVVAKVGCPKCGRELARVHQGPGGRLTVEYRSPEIAEEGDHLDRPWNVTTWQTTDGSTWTGVECVCKDARGCGVTFVLERVRVRELAERAGVRGAPIRWRPGAADVERSGRLWPTFHLNRVSAPVYKVAALTKLTPPPPLIEADLHVRRSKVRAS
jgi:hypothetical protein